MASGLSGSEEIGRIIDVQIPWHRAGRVPDVLAPPVERPLAQELWRLNVGDGPRRNLLVLGARRVGKTTAMYQTVRHLLDGAGPGGQPWWLRLDYPVLLRCRSATS